MSAGNARHTSPPTAAAAPTRGDLWRLRLLYMMVFASYGTTGVYRSLYFRRVGLDDLQIGALIAIMPLAMLISGPLWSIVADRLGLRARLLTLLTGLSILPELAMAATGSYPVLMALVVLNAVFLGPVQPLLDSTALTVLGGARHQYAGIRAYGSLGYAPIAWLTGVLIQGRDIRWVFVGHAVLMSMGCLASLGVHAAPARLPRSIGAGLITLLRSRVWVLFMAAVFVAMIAQSVSFGYVGLYLDNLGGSESLIGFAGALGSVVQTVLMWGTLPWMLQRWGSQRLMVLSLVAYALRFAVWALAPLTWAVTASQALLGFTFGAALVASVDFADEHAPEGMKATSQALVTSFVSGLGRSLGGLLGGSLYHGVGPQGAFGVFSVLCAAGAVCFGAIWRGNKTRKV